MSPRLFYTLYLLAVVVVVGGLFEALLRTGDFPHLDPRPDERSVLYHYDSELGWAAKPDTDALYVASERIQVRHNALGLRDAMPDTSRRHRLVVFGDSYVWGFDVTEEDRFTEHLESEQPTWDVVNAGVSGYGTDQALLLAERILPDLQPDAVLLVYTPQNDHVDNATNVRYNGYYKPYFVVSGDTLALQGVPVPVPARYRYEEMPVYLVRLVVDAYTRLKHPAVTVPDPSLALIRRFHEQVESGGAAFVVGLERADPEIEAGLDSAGIPWINLDAESRFRIYGKHWDPAGHREVADRLQPFLAEHVLGWTAAGESAAGDVP